MTGFMITLDEAVESVWHTFADMVGGEIYIKKNTIDDHYRHCKSYRAQNEFKIIVYALAKNFMNK